jgi:anaerobic magnesium-protoporphyrin IX monomethyl ester cyclase
VKVKFINPSPDDAVNTAMYASMPPLGLLYIAAILQQEGIDVTILDQSAQGYSLTATVNWALREAPDLLGISALLSSSQTAVMLARTIKQRAPNIPIVFGNHHASFNAERLLQTYPWIDYVIRGEGEYICSDLVASLAHPKTLKDITGLTYRHRGNIVSTPDRPVITNIDQLPFPARHLVPHNYHNTVVGINVAPKKFTTLLSSRGCPFQCRFCSCTTLSQHQWRPRSIENILTELHTLMSNGYQQAMFVDDNLTVQPQRVIDLCTQMIREKINLEWMCEGRVDQASRSMLQAMVAAGCRMIYFGIESANPQTLAYYRKKITPQQATKAIHNAHDAGIDVIVGSFIIGAPEETIEDIERTMSFARRLPLDIVQINVLRANPGTPIWNELVQAGWIDEAQYWERGAFIPEVSPNAVQLKTLEELMNHHYRHFLLHPRFFLRQLARTVTSRYRINTIYQNVKNIPSIGQQLIRLQYQNHFY